MSTFWLFAWTLTLAMSWLLPNHYMPWVGFHADAWMALVCLIGSIWLIATKRQPMVWHPISILAGGLVFLPWIQWSFGLISITGNAWISSTYLLGFLLALLAGAHWEKHHPGQLLLALFSAFLIATILSVGVELKQWLEVDGLWLWVMIADPTRPSANLAQPNQLGTLLLCGLLANVWMYEKRYFSPPTAIVVSLFVLFGVALTSSRTAWVGLAWLVLAAWLWRGHWRHRQLPWVALGMTLYFALCIYSLATTNDYDQIKRFTHEGRLAAWPMFIDAIMQHPWLGYGWNQTAVAQTTVAASHPAIGTNFTYAHNLLIDLLLWCGIPLGLFTFGVAFVWLWRRIQRVNLAEHALAALVLVVMANHAMFEMPLYYAYFLLPFGLIAGNLNVSLGAPRTFATPGWLTWFIWLLAGTLLILVLRDYSRIEPSYNNLVAERQQIKVKRLAAPDVLLLSQWKDQIELSRFKSIKEESQSELQRMRQVASLYPSSLFSYTLASTLALNHQPQEARLWLVRLCKMSPEQYCQTAQSMWLKQGLLQPDIAAIAWPVGKP